MWKAKEERKDREVMVAYVPLRGRRKKVREWLGHSAKDRKESWREGLGQKRKKGETKERSRVSL